MAPRMPDHPREAARPCAGGQACEGRQTATPKVCGEKKQQQTFLFYSAKRLANEVTPSIEERVLIYSDLSSPEASTDCAMRRALSLCKIEKRERQSCICVVTAWVHMM